MAANNLRIISANRVTGVSGSFSGTSDNLLNDIKSMVATTSSTSFSVSVSGLDTSKPVGVILVMPGQASAPTSMSASGLGLSASGSTVVTNTGVIGYGGETYLAAYGDVSSSSGTITITVASGTVLSRVIVGNYWSPTFNTPFGMRVGYIDLTNTERTQAGDLYSINAPRHKTLAFDLSYMNESDKFKMFEIVRTNGKITPLFVSLFPPVGSATSDLEKEQMYSIYGKFDELTNISHTMWTMYATSIQIEGI